MFYETYSSPPYTSSLSQDSSRKRKRHSDDEEDLHVNEFMENDHISKKQRDEVIVTPLTPTSPPSSIISINSCSPPATGHDIPYNNTDNKKTVITHPSYVAQHQHHTKSHSSSEVESTIPSQNLFLRNLHLNSRTYQFNQGRLRSMDHDQEMWEEEEEVVAERYSAMNKVLGSRKRVY